MKGWNVFKVEKQAELVLRRMAAFQALCNSLRNLEETIVELLELNQLLPEGELRNKLVDEISALDAIADGMRKALGLCVSQ